MIKKDTAGKALSINTAWDEAGMIEFIERHTRGKWRDVVTIIANHRQYCDLPEEDRPDPFIPAKRRSTTFTPVDGDEEWDAEAAIEQFVEGRSFSKAFIYLCKSCRLNFIAREITLTSDSRKDPRIYDGEMEG